MPRVDRYRLAEEDLLDIATYIARDNPTVAVNWLDQIEAKLLTLAKQPLMGEAIDHIRPGLRRITHGRYLLYYEPHESGVSLVRVLDGARKIEKL